jgi:excisionase family DNA binding protein
MVERRIGAQVWQRSVEQFDYLDVPEAALAMNGADRTTIYRLIREGRLRAIQRDGAILIQRAEVDRYLRAAASQGRGRRLGQRWRSR